MPTPAIIEPPGYGSLRRAVAWSELPRRGVIEARGADAVAFVDRFTTAALAGLAPGQGSETVFTDARGWVLALALAMRHDDGLEIDCGPAPRVALADHLEHFHIRERVAFRDVGDEVVSFLLAGPAAAEVLATRVAPPPAAAGEHVAATIDTAAVRIIRIDCFDIDAFMVRAAAGDAAIIRRWLDAAALERTTTEAVDAIRIESRFPVSADIVDKTLPQELDRPPRTISFTKGCYLGQETVARLDALGHVNRSLTLVACAAPAPPAVGTPVLVDGGEAGVVTSACLSPLHATAVALGIVHRRCHDPSAVITIGDAGARVIPVPTPQRPVLGGPSP